MNNKDIIKQYVDTGVKIPKKQFNKLNSSLLNTYLRKRLISISATEPNFMLNSIRISDYELLGATKDYQFKILQQLNKGDHFNLIANSNYPEEILKIIIEYEPDCADWNYLQGIHHVALKGLLMKSHNPIELYRLFPEETLRIFNEAFPTHNDKSTYVVDKFFEDFLNYSNNNDAIIEIITGNIENINWAKHIKENKEFFLSMLRRSKNPGLVVFKFGTNGDEIMKELTDKDVDKLLHVTLNRKEICKLLHKYNKYSGK